MWMVDLYAERGRSVREQTLQDFSEIFPSCQISFKNGTSGPYWQAAVSDDKRKDVQSFLKARHIRYRWYESCWARSSNYREQFFGQYKGELRCRYCNRKLSKKTTEVDHLVPVARVKRNGYSRWLLKRKRIKNINDIRNLVPSCRRCNRRKGTRMGLWYWRGILGKYKAYWVVVHIAALLLLFLSCALLAYGIHNYF